MSVTQLKREVCDGWAEAPAAKLSLRLIDFIHELPENQRSLLTYTTFSRAAGKERIDEELVAAISILASSPVAALNVHGMFVDNDSEYELTAEQMQEAEEIGALVHPETGELVSNFEEKVFPFFTASTRFQD